MDSKDEAFLRKLLSTFRIEAEEHMAKISSGLIELERAPVERRMEIVETVFREAHSMKGAARAVNLPEIESICRSMETVFASLKRKQIVLTQDVADTLHASLGELGRLIEAEGKKTGAKGQTVRDATGRPENTSVADRQSPGQKNVMEPGMPGPLEEEPPEVSREVPEIFAPGGATADTTRISKAKLDDVLLRAEGLLSAKQSASQRCVELRDVMSEVILLRKNWAKMLNEVRAAGMFLAHEGVPGRGLKKRSKLSNLIELVEANENFVKALQGKLTVLERALERDRRALGAMVDGLLDDVKSAAMSPFSSVLEILPGIVREISRSQGKEAELVISGGDIEIDRRILEEMKDPLVHLIRNCIDHGVEKPQDRAMKNKPASGTVTIAVSHLSGKKVEILISDDGSGIDIAGIKASAVKAGIISSAEAGKLEDEEIVPLVFQSGVTASPIITDISGRGLGLAIVLEKIEKLRGMVSCETLADVGTTFRIELPLSLATFRGVLVRVSEHLFVLPTMYLERVVRVKRDEIKTVENRGTIVLNGRAIPLVALDDILGMSMTARSYREKEFVQAVVLGSAERLIAVEVAEVVNEQEVLVKGLGSQLNRVKNIAGSTVLGTGTVVPILNVPDLVKSAVKTSASAGKSFAPLPEASAGRKNILVVEDSITSRTLLKNILEVAGYDVQTAVDGMDAYTRLRGGEFDLIVSDVDMPRMNGFDLTLKVRADKKFAELPVVLVTALESAEDREHGIDVGANAYIVKSSFDQSNLLETIRRLV